MSENNGVLVTLSERQELESLRKKVGLSYEEREMLVLADMVSRAVERALGAIDGAKVVVINNLEIQVNYAGSSGASVTISNNKGSGIAASASDHRIGL